VKYATRLSRLGTESAFELLAQARALEAEGHDIVHLEIGEPDFDTPRNVKDAGIKAINDGWTHYTPSAGIPEMREKYAQALNDRYGSHVTAKNIVITPGAKPVIFLGGLAVIDEGDEVIYPNPGYPSYESVTQFLGAKAVPYVLREENEFRFSLDEVASLITPKTKMIVINSPHNPTGGVLTREDLQGVVDLALKHDLWVLSDEVYSRILYDGEHVGLMDFPEIFDRMILLEGHSKTYAMTGWRLGYVCCNEELAVHMTRLTLNANSCAAAFTQIAGGEALLGDQSAVKQMVAEFKVRRDLIVKGLNELPGVTCHNPRGAFYVFPNFKAYGMSSSELEQRLLHEAGVCCLAGKAFGKMGEGYLRFSYANSQENIKKALERIGEWLDKHQK